MTCTTWRLLVLAVMATTTCAELPDEYAVFKIKQKTACSTIFCPWYCERYIDANGCLFCGKCSKPPQPFACPIIKCPSLPQLDCVSRPGRDGCNVCKCRPRPECPPTPMCSRFCRLQKDGQGCERCSCPPRKDCPEAVDAPCPRPGCWRERGADGCYNCRCHDDVAVCPEVKCDVGRCQHVVDHATGCAVSCLCGSGRNDV